MLSGLSPARAKYGRAAKEGLIFGWNRCAHHPATVQYPCTLLTNRVVEDGPSTGPERLTGEYESKLAAACRFNREFETVVNHDVDEAEGRPAAGRTLRSAAHEGADRNVVDAMSDRIDDMLRSRVALLRRMGAPTIERALVAFTRRSAVHQAERSIDRYFEKPVRTRGTRRRRDAGAGPTAKLDGAPDEVAAFVAAQEAVVTQLGLSRLPERTESPRETAWLVVARGDLLFQMKQHFQPLEAGVAGPSRITKLCVKSLRDPTRWYASFDGGWDTACIDRSIQREIDRLVAALG